MLAKGGDMGVICPLAYGGSIIRSQFLRINMSNLTRFATPLIAVALMTSVPLMTQAQNSLTSNQPTTTNNTVQNTQPAGDEQTKKGYRDGMEAAKLDKLTNRPLSFSESHLYVHPPVKGDARDAYRSGFQAGYQSAVAHGSAS